MLKWSSAVNPKWKIDKTDSLPYAKSKHSQGHLIGKYYIKRKVNRKIGRKLPWLELFSQRSIGLFGTAWARDQHQNCKILHHLYSSLPDPIHLVTKLNLPCVRNCPIPIFSLNFSFKLSQWFWYEQVRMFGRLWSLRQRGCKNISGVKTWSLNVPPLNDQLVGFFYSRCSYAEYTALWNVHSWS